VLRDLTEDIEDIYHQGRLTDLPGVGKGSAEKIAQWLETGRVQAYDELIRTSPSGPRTAQNTEPGAEESGRLLNERGIRASTNWKRPSNPAPSSA